MPGDKVSKPKPRDEDVEDTTSDGPKWWDIRRFDSRTLIALALVVGILFVPAAQAAGALLNATTTSGAVTIAADNGPQVTFTGDRTVNLADGAFPDSDTVNLTTASGNVTLSSSSPTNVTVDSASGTWTNTSGLDVTGATLSINPEDKQRVNVSGDTETLDFREISVAQVDDGETDLVYSGASGTTTLTVHGLPPNIVVAAVDQGTGNIVKSVNTGSDGVATFSGLSNSEHRLDLQQQDDPPYVETADPSGGDYRSNRSVTLEARIVDPAGGNVDVVITHNGGEVYNATVSSGTTITQPVTAQAGQNTWSVQLTGSDGEIATSETFSYVTPGYITIKEANGNTLLTSETVNVEMVSEDSDFSRTTTTTTGSLDLADVPNERIKVELSAANYSDRTLFLDDPSKNVTTVLYPAPSSSLPNSSETFEQSFSLTDNTGQFPAADTVLVVEAHINGSWEDVASNEFGAANIANVTLRDEVTYRLRVRNRDNDVRTIGLYEADQSNAGLIQPLLIEGFSTQDVVGEYGFNQTADIVRPESDDEEDYIQFNFTSGNQTTVRNFTVEIYEYGNQSNKAYQANNFGLVDSLVLIQPLSDADADKTWVVDWTATVDGESEEGKLIVGRNILGPGIPLSPIWQHTISMGLLLVMSAFFGRARAPQGGVIVALTAGILWTAGWLPAAVGGGAVVLGLFVAIMFMVNARGGIR